MATDILTVFGVIDAYNTIGGHGEVGQKIKRRVAEKEAHFAALLAPMLCHGPYVGHWQMTMRYVCWLAYLDLLGSRTGGATETYKAESLPQPGPVNTAKSQKPTPTYFPPERQGSGPPAPAETPLPPTDLPPEPSTPAPRQEDPLQVSARKSNDPEAPYGRKADGTPRKKPGARRKKKVAPTVTDPIIPIDKDTKEAGAARKAELSEVVAKLNAMKAKGE